MLLDKVNEALGLCTQTSGTMGGWRRPFTEIESHLWTGSSPTSIRPLGRHPGGRRILEAQMGGGGGDGDCTGPGDYREFGEKGQDRALGTPDILKLSVFVPFLMLSLYFRTPA